MGINELRKISQVGPFAMFDFAASYLVVIIIWMIGLAVWSWPGKVLVCLVLSVIPLSVASHIFISSSGPKLNTNTKRTALTDMFLDTKANFSSVTSKVVVFGSLAGIVGTVVSML